MPVAIGTMGPGIKIEDFFTPVTQNGSCTPAVVVCLKEKANREITSFTLRDSRNPTLEIVSFGSRFLFGGGWRCLSKEFWQGLDFIVMLAN